MVDFTVLNGRCNRCEAFCLCAPTFAVLRWAAIRHKRIRAARAAPFRQVLARKDGAEQPGRGVVISLGPHSSVGLFRLRVLGASVRLWPRPRCKPTASMPCVRSRAFLRPCRPRMMASNQAEALACIQSREFSQALTQKGAAEQPGQARRCCGPFSRLVML